MKFAKKKINKATYEKKKERKLFNYILEINEKRKKANLSFPKGCGGSVQTYIY